MKKLLYLLAGMPLLLCAQEENKTHPDTGRGIRFEKGLSWEQTKTKAKAENKYIFLDAYTTWCAPCKLMDKNVYSNDTVGEFMNDKFISIKVQMDSTGRDNEDVKKWYTDARAIEQEYKIEGFPSYLFFNADGRLIFKDLGYKSVPDFLQLMNKALNPQNILYYQHLEDFKKGKKNPEIMYDLAQFARNTLGDDTLARKIAADYINSADRKQLLSREKIYFVKDVARNRKLADSLALVYKDNYLNKLSEKELCTSEILGFMNRFSHLLTSKDKFFQLCYSQPQKIDSAMNYKGGAEYFIHKIIIKEEIESRLFKNDKPVFNNPDWNNTSAIIAAKYPGVDVKKLILNYQRFYYSQLKDCTKWAGYQDEIIRSYRFKPAPPQIFYELNDLGAWAAFLNCNEEKVLTKALEWIDLAIKLSESDSNANIMAFFDTRANILYKLGRVKEAIAQEEKAVATGLARSGQEEKVNLETLMPAVNMYKEIIKKMKKGEPTYVEQGAVWDAKTLKKIQIKKTPHPKGK